MNARMTLIGLERHLNEFYNKSISDNWTISDSENFDKQALLYTIVTKGGQFEPLYTDPRYFAEMSSLWWAKWSRTFNKWFSVFDKEYEPLWDRNGYEEVHEDTTDAGTNDTITNNRETTDNDTTVNETTAVTEVMDDDTTGHKENKVSAYDSDTYQPETEEISQGTDDRTTTTNGTRNTVGTDDTTRQFTGNIDNDTTNDRDFDRTYHSWGNWGISQTSQKLLEQELKIQGWNIYEHIADIFCNELLIRVY